MTDTLIPGGLLVAIEGIDGAGKTTLARSLAALLERAGLAVSVSKEPTTGPWGSILRKSASDGRLTPDREVELLLLDRSEHVRNVIRPGLNAGAVVILDRYFPSMVAYQGAHGLSVSSLLEKNAFAPVPDLTIMLDVDPAVGLARIAARGDIPNHFETAENLLRCRQIFLTMKLPSRRVIDASAGPDVVRFMAVKEFLVVAANKLAADSGLTVQNVERMRSLSEAVTA